MATKYKLPSYLQDKKVNEVLDISSRIRKPLATKEGSYETFNFNLPKNLPTKTYNSSISSLSTLPTPSKSFESMTSKELLDYAKQNKSSFKLIDSRKRELNKLIGAKQNEEYVPEPIKEIKNPILKFLDRTLGASADTATYGTGNISKSDTGNKVANTVADIVGTGLGMAVNPLGMPSASKLLSPIGNYAEKIVPKVSQPVVNKILPSAVRGASEFGAYGALEGYAKGEDIYTTLKNVGTNALGGAVFGAGTKALGMGLNKILPKKTIPVEATKTSILNPSGKLKPVSQSVNIKPGETVNLNELARNQSKDNNILESTLPKPKAKIVSSAKPKNFNESLKNFYTRVVDINNPIKKVDNRTYTLATNSKNVGGTVDFILKEGLVDTQGNKIGSSLKDIANNIPKGQEKNFWEYVLQRHNIARSAEGKPIYKEYTPEMSAAKVKQFETSNPEWKAKADNITQWLDKFMNEWGVNTGILDKDLYAQLRKTYPSYVPTNRDFSALEGAIPKTNGRGFANQSTPISKATGSDRNITDPIENIMNLVNRTVRTAKYNEVGKSLVNAIESNPNLSTIAEIIPQGTKINSNVKNIVSVLIDGKPVNVQINDKNLLDAMNKINQSNLGTIESAAKKATSLFKSLITQKNPVFAIRNIARDIPTAYIYGNEKNPLKFGKDLLSAGKDLVTNSPTAQQYRALGGGGSNFFSSDNVAKSVKELTGRKPITDKLTGEIIGYKNVNPIKKGLSKLGKGIEKFNNLTESAPRLAEFKRTLNRTGDTQQALYDAADVTTNFSRGGDVAKSIDSFVPYLNASIQGLDKAARQFKNKPIATILKGATAITAPTLILNYINKDNDNYKQLDNRTKDNYYLFPKEDGTFIKLPKSRELGVLFGSLTERTLRQLNGEKEAFKGFNTTVSTNFSPVNPVSQFILAPLVYNIPKNKDFANRTIVPQNMVDRSPQYQYDETTSEIAKKLGEIPIPQVGKEPIHLSPKQVDYLIRSYTGVIGQLALPANVKANQQSPTTPISKQFIADPIYSNQAITDFYDKYDKIKQSAADRNFNESIPSKTVTEEEKIRNYYTKVSKSITDLSKQAKEAERNNDMVTVRDIRKKIIDLAKEANSKY